MKSLATIEEPLSGPLTVPDFLRDEHSSDGLENITKDDLIVPRLALCQSSNDERKKSKDKYIEGLNDGDFFNSLTQEIYGPLVQVIPLTFSKTRIYFKPPVGSGVILCRSANSIDGGTLATTCELCPNHKYIDDKPPVCTLFANFPVLLLPKNPAGQPELLILSMKSTALNAARNWTSRMTSLNLRHKKAVYSWFYEIRSQEQTKPKGTFFGPIVTCKGFVTSNELYNSAKKAFNDLNGVVITMEDDVDREAQEDRKIPF